ncbi:NUDIX hydrolase domain-like protein [Pterulicium gracile]|uniref:NUDIX hydrolase domain-like protein n=1 Tax=Pterulicium gracile TaxID=1884261 RepID=A0A5C3QY83_9AGAR|nr:NUDIX hydrolase domain-like protein [Pterula gracilis]
MSTSSSSLVIAPSVSQYNIPLADLLSQNGNKRLVVGVAVIVPAAIAHADSAGASTTHKTQNKLLVVQRAVAEESFAGMYELPGGHADAIDGDQTLLDAVVRETREETGLEVVEIVGEFKGFEYVAGRSGETTRQFNFVVKVRLGGEGEGLAVRLNPEEHQKYAWVREEKDLEELSLTGSMEDVVKDALRYL